jgi:hypothetical protein
VWIRFIVAPLDAGPTEQRRGAFAPGAGPSWRQSDSIQGM